MKVISPFVLFVLRSLSKEERRPTELYSMSRQQKALGDMELDGLVVYDGDYYRITPKGGAVLKHMNVIARMLGMDSAEEVETAVEERNEKRRAYMRDYMRAKREKEGERSSERGDE